MGRYYSGDIDGKFWFAVQCSTAADRFGSTGTEPNYLDYYFDEEDIGSIEKELKKMEEENGFIFQELDVFFERNNGYNDFQIIDFLIGRGNPQIIHIRGEFPKKEAEERCLALVKVWLREYADKKLGEEIFDCVNTNGSCSFQAEL